MSRHQPVKKTLPPARQQRVVVPPSVSFGTQTDNTVPICPPKGRDAAVQTLPLPTEELSRQELAKFEVRKSFESLQQSVDYLVNPFANIAADARRDIATRVSHSVGAHLLGEYRETANRIRQHGELPVEAFSKYAPANPQLKLRTLAQYKSHMVLARNMELRPFQPTEDALLNKYVAGSVHHQNTQNHSRGGISREQFLKLLEQLRASKIAYEKREMWMHAWYVQYYATLRPHEVQYLTPEHFGFEAGTLIVFAVRKAPGRVCVDQGRYEVHAVPGQRSWTNLLRILQAALAKGATKLMYPGYDYSAAGQWIKKTADRLGWNKPGAPKIDGTHALRHGRASELFVSAIRSVMSQTGAWRSVGGASNYCHVADRHTFMRKANLGDEAYRVTLAESEAEVDVTIAAL